MSPASTQGHGGGSSKATKVYSRDECGKDGWVPTGGVASLWVGLGVGEIRNFELVGVGGKHCWLDDGVGLSLQDPVHCFQFADISIEVRRVGRDHG